MVTVVTVTTVTGTPPAAGDGHHGNRDPPHRGDGDHGNQEPPAMVTVTVATGTPPPALAARGGGAWGRGGAGLARRHVTPASDGGGERRGRLAAPGRCRGRGAAGASEPPEPPSSRWRDNAAFWILGLCNNFAYVVMLSAAHDILRREPGAEQAPADPPHGANGSVSPYDCNPMSTGAVLLADILPTLLIKLVAPFGLHLLPYSPRAVLCALGAWGSFALVSLSAGVALSLAGVVLASASSGLGEVTFLALASLYPRAAVASWASGTGAAGLGGALAYGALTQAGLGPPRALLPMLAVPQAALLSYFCLLRPPPPPPPPAEQPLLGAPPEPPPPGTKWRVVKGLLKYLVPLTIVYFAEYFINQGLLELLYFPGSALSHAEQYRWYQLAYQAGVFASRSSLRCVRLRRVWLLALLQSVNAGLVLSAVVGRWLPGPAAASALVGYEGLLGGAAYANAFARVALEAPPEQREFAMAVAAVGDALGIALAAGAAVAAHDFFCRHG
ncbi:battenin [Apteryx mantelli]|uniref:Battenin n=1 Tax=Apteryx mantelli TaxID=2696672 RepID=A0ABM4G6P1_9AVES